MSRQIARQPPYNGHKQLLISEHKRAAAGHVLGAVLREEPLTDVTSGGWGRSAVTRWAGNAGPLCTSGAPPPMMHMGHSSVWFLAWPPLASPFTISLKRPASEQINSMTRG